MYVAIPLDNALTVREKEDLNLLYLFSSLSI